MPACGGGLEEREEPTCEVRVSFHSGLPLRWHGSLPAIPAPRGWLFRCSKRGLDIAVSACALVVLSAPLLFVAAVIKMTSRGPVLFTQRRVGFMNRPFTILKFRTLRFEQADPSGVAQTRPNDARLTRVGAILRRTSIDELPQLLNVLAGDMSLVGPRPHVEGMLAAGMDYRELVPGYDLRHLVKPGLTGWAQAHGFRGPTTSAEEAIARIHHNFAYVQAQSLRLDLKILLMTARRQFLTGSGT